jgi:5-formyltetrahydrofolate cyclo-ligase
VQETLKSQKSALRLHILKRRDALPDPMRHHKSLVMAQLAIRQLPLEQSDTIAFFLPIRSEINLIPLMVFLENKNIPICAPAIINNDILEFRTWQSDAAMMDMGFGTQGPKEGATVLIPTCIFLPLIAFDSLGNRLGYGRGFYDKTIDLLHQKGKKPRLIGVAFDCQEVDNVPTEIHDKTLNGILTESGLRHF